MIADLMATERELLDGLFADDELAELLDDLGEPETTDAEPQMDRAAELNKKWQVQAGDLWRVGEHRLLCGDSTKREDVERLMGGETQADTMTDPPYGIGYAYDKHADTPDGNAALVEAVLAIAPGAKIFTPGKMNLARELKRFPTAKVLAWHKGFAQAGNGIGGASTWEPVVCVDVDGGTLPNDYLHFSTDREPGLRDSHPCPKPVALFAHLIQHLTKGEIYEPFLGSGTTMVAAENLRRKCYGIEISPDYCAVILERMATAFPALAIERA